MFGLFDQRIKDQNDCRQQRDTADNPDDNTFGHYNTKVFAECKGHQAQCCETGYRCDGTGDDGFEGIGYCMAHCSVLFSWESFFILFKTVQQEDGVVHRNTKLKDCYQCLCQIRNLTQENIRSHIIQNGDSDTKQEQNRHNKGSSGDFQYDKRKQCRDCHINRKFLQTQVLDISYNTGHTTDKTLFVYNRTHTCDCLHRLIRGSGIVKQNQHHRRIFRKENIFQIFWHHTGWYADIRNIIIPEYFFDMFHFFKLIFQFLHIFHRHIFDNDH